MVLNIVLLHQAACDTYKKNDAATKRVPVFSAGKQSDVLSSKSLRMSQSRTNGSLRQPASNARDRNGQMNNPVVQSGGQFKDEDDAKHPLDSVRPGGARSEWNSGTPWRRRRVSARHRTVSRCHVSQASGRLAAAAAT